MILVLLIFLLIRTINININCCLNNPQKKQNLPLVGPLEWTVTINDKMIVWLLKLSTISSLDQKIINRYTNALVRYI